jgi:hypothetical protein
MSDEYVIESADGERGTRMLVVEDATLPIPEESPAEVVNPLEAALEEATTEETTEVAQENTAEDQAEAAPTEPENADQPTGLTEADGLAIVSEAVNRVAEEENKRDIFVSDFSKNMHKELLRAINESDIHGINEGYYSKPVFKTKFGMVSTDQFTNTKFYSFGSKWVSTFLAYAYSQTNNKSFLEVLFDAEEYAEMENIAVNTSLRESSFYKESDPFSIRKPLTEDDHRKAIHAFYLAPDSESGFEEFLDRHSDIFNIMQGLSRREMDGQINEIYFDEILPKVGFTSEEFTPSNEIIEASKIAKKFVYRKVKSTATGSEFYTITGERTKIATIASIFKNVLADNSIKFQYSYRYLATEFISNGWWHPSIVEVIKKDKEKIPNPEKIFTPNLFKVSDEKRKEAMEQIKRIKTELIPEDSVLALTSPFVFERPEEPPFKSARHEESEMTFLPEFLTEDCLVPNMSTRSLNSDGRHGLPEKEIVDAISCGLLSDDLLNSSRKLLEFPDLPANATIILRDLELK